VLCQLSYVGMVFVSYRRSADGLDAGQLARDLHGPVGE
jgi:hypothetical protein